MRSIFRGGFAAVLIVGFASPVVAIAATIPPGDETTRAQSGHLSLRQQATEKRIGALAEKMAASDDLRLRIIFSYSFDVFDSAQPFGEKIHPEAIRTSARTLNEMARGSTDPVALDLLFDRVDLDIRRFHGCGSDRDARRACDLKDDLVDIARRWTEADAQNQRAWLALSRARHLRGDEAAARATYVRASQASEWRDDLVEVSRLVADAAPLDLSSVDRLAWMFEANLSALKLSKLEPAGEDYCRPGPVFGVACLRIVDTSVRDSDSTWILSKAAKTAARAGASEDVIAAFRRKEDAIDWALDQDVPIMVRVEPTSLKDYDETEARDALVRMEPRIYLSERSRAERILLEKNVSEAEAAGRYAAAAPGRKKELERFMRELDAKQAAGAGVNADSAHSTAASP